jgi:hypothetical protein
LFLKVHGLLGHNLNAAAVQQSKIPEIDRGIPVDVKPTARCQFGPFAFVQVPFGRELSPPNPLATKRSDRFALNPVWRTKQYLN